MSCLCMWVRTSVSESRNSKQNQPRSETDGHIFKIYEVIFWPRCNVELSSFLSDTILTNQKEKEELQWMLSMPSTYFIQSCPLVSVDCHFRNCVKKGRGRMKLVFHWIGNRILNLMKGENFAKGVKNKIGPYRDYLSQGVTNLYSLSSSMKSF